MRSLVGYVREQRAVCGSVPDDRELVLEHFRDEVGAVRIVLHAPFGGRVNAPWGMALAQRVREALSGIGNRERGTGNWFGRPGSRFPSSQSRCSSQTTDDGIMLRLPNLGGPHSGRRDPRARAAEAERRILDEVGSTSLFGARFRMNAARALLLPRGNPQTRMPLWLQRLKALDLLADRPERSRRSRFSSRRIATCCRTRSTCPRSRRVLGDLRSGAIRVRVVELDRPSPFAASLQFGFVMDWLYVDDTPRAEQRAAYLSLDRALLDEVMGSEGADPETTEAIDEVLAIRRGTARESSRAKRRRACSAHRPRG